VGKRSTSKGGKRSEPVPAVLPKTRRASPIHFALLAVLCLVVYANSLTGEFVWDDNVQIVRNESIRSLENIPRMFTSSLWSFAGSNTAGTNTYYRPLQTTIFTVVYQLAGLSPLAYHIANVLLHTMSTLVIYALFLELRVLGPASLVPAALFAVHPVHVEAVAWIAGAGELACGFFYFTALWTFCRYLNIGRGVWLGVSAICFLLALLSKEMAVTLPVAALLIVWMKRGDLQLSAGKCVRALLPYASVLAFYGVLRLSVIAASGTSTLPANGTALDWVTFGIWMFGRYLRYAFVPYPLAAFHLTSLSLASRIASTALYALLIAAILLLLYLRRNAERTGLFWIGLFAVTLAPVFYLKGITGGFLFAERYLYIPTVPAMALLTALGLQLPRKPAAFAAITLIVVFSAATVLQNRVWRNDETLYAHSVAVYPENTYGWVRLAGIHLNKGDSARAQKAFEMAGRTIDNRYLQPADTAYLLELGLGTLAARRNSASDAKVHLRRALEINPNGENAYTILAGVLTNLERNFEGAIPLLERAIELDPVDDQARDSMGVALYNLRRHDEAIANFREALRINPQSELARQHLETALRRISN
jgi:tetratricopeptide (TPR) repeat protein